MESVGYKLWECFDTCDEHIKIGWKDSLIEVASFSSYTEFWSVWDSLPHCKPSNFFQSKDESGKVTAKYYAHPKIKGLGKIQTLCVF
jgi:hypothetical protein